MHSDNTTQFHLVKITILAAVIGVLAGLTAELLHRLIGYVTNLVFYGHISHHIVSPLSSSPVLLIIIPALGGLLIGAMAKYGTPLVRGHGIPEAMEAVLTNRSKIHPKVALLKPISAAISLGSGQPFGAEGPIIQTGAAIGSLLGQLFSTTTTERKVLLACGAGAGLAATFGTPIASVIFAIELLLFEFRTRSFIPLVIASTLATEVHISILGPKPVFALSATDFGGPSQLAFYLLLGIICGGVAIFITKGLYLIEKGFHRLPISTYLYPMIGGGFVGIIGYLTHHYTYSGIDVFGPGYYVIENILNDQYVFGFLVILLLAKASVWLVALGSGTSGGTLAPIFMIGAATGAIVGNIMNSLLPALNISPAAFALAGMAAVFGSSTRATFASIIFAFEMTQNYEAILPVMFTCVIADFVVSKSLKTTILTEQLHQGGVLVNHDYEADLLKMVRVGDIMDVTIEPISSLLNIGDVYTEINKHTPAFAYHDLILTDAEGELAGMITHKDVRQAMAEGQKNMNVLEIASRNVLTVTPSTSIYNVIITMFEHNIGCLPVVDENIPTKVVGYLSRSNVLQPYLQQLHDEQILEQGWFRNYLAQRRVLN